MDYTNDHTNDNGTNNNGTNEIIDMIMRQTNYTREIIIEKLVFHNNNYENVIREYLFKNKTVLNSENECNKTLQQKIYTEIRIFMDKIYK